MSSLRSTRVWLRPAMPRSEPERRPRSTLDWFGVTASTACAIHCAVLPFVMLLAPAVAGRWIFGEVVGRCLAGVSAIVALRAVAAGRACHGCWTPTVLASAGIAFILTAEVLFEGRPWLGPMFAATGGAGLVGAHAGNILLLRRCACSTAGAVTVPSDSRPVR